MIKSLLTNIKLMITVCFVALSSQLQAGIDTLVNPGAENLNFQPRLTDFTQTTLTEPKKLGWFDKISLGGYVQLRYNRLFETNPEMKCDQCDKSIGAGNGFFIRRNRLRVA